MAAANWSEFPSDLLYLISERIDNEIDLIRFRSICSNWRSSSIPNHHTNTLPFKFPLLKYILSSDSDSDDDFSDSIDDYEFSYNMNINDSKFPFSYLSKRSLFLIKPPPQQDQTLIHRPWLVGITQNSTGKTKIFQPDALFESLVPSIHYSNMLDFNELSVLHIVTNFFNDDGSTLSTFFDQPDYLNPGKVLAVTCYGKKPLVLAALCFVTHRPVLFRGLDERWTPIPFSTFYGDICVFKGQIYAVNLSGRTFVVGPESSIELRAQPFVPGVTQKLLVESEGKLLLVNMCDSFPDFFGIDLFQLDEKENKWVKLKDIGDRVLFLGGGCSFSAYASELGLPKGNCVVFFDSSVLCIGNLGEGKCVFHLDQNRLSPVSEYPEYLNLFLPPEWILKS